MLLAKIHLLSFMLAFAFGLLLCYLIEPTPDVVLKFPSPMNTDRVTYKDRSHTCYRYRAAKVPCPKDMSLVLPQPIMEDFRVQHQWQQPPQRKLNHHSSLFCHPECKGEEEKSCC